MFVSLVMPTLSRVEEVNMFMKSLEYQTYKDFELIVVDQNEDDRLSDIIKNFEDKFKIKYIKSNKKGLSHNRNIGIEHATGDIVAFPDDDCEYDVDTLKKVVDFLSENKEYNFYSCNCKDKNLIDSFVKMRESDTDINSGNIFSTVLSITIFIKFQDRKYLKFDEMLGVGTEYGSGEEVDYMLELLSRGYKGRYFAQDVIFHPAKKHSKSKEKYKRDYSYGKGFGALCKKEIVYRKNIKFSKHFLYKITRNIGAIVLNKDRDYHTASIKGRMAGFFGYKK
ncbi:MAG: glycosyltransferase family 2 protein [Clostridioides sp.]|jgi:glycosyltransferase involved in cell wall biosynthesis|nr:glycosyltransferase family 2 protein [Clostridioides sp.]